MFCGLPPTAASAALGTAVLDPPVTTLKAKPDLSSQNLQTRIAEFESKTGFIRHYLHRSGKVTSKYDQFAGRTPSFSPPTTPAVGLSVIMEDCITDRSAGSALKHFGICRRIVPGWTKTNWAFGVFGRRPGLSTVPRSEAGKTAQKKSDAKTAINLIERRRQ